MKFFKPSFARRFLLVYTLVLVVLFVVAEMMVLRSLRHQGIFALEKSLETQAQLLAELIPSGSSPEFLQRFVSEKGNQYRLRISVIGPDGKVLADSGVTFSELTTLDNHKARPEIGRALDGKTGAAIRFSHTIQKEMLYVAVPYHRNNAKKVFRVAVDLETVERTLAAFRKPFWISFTGILSAFLLLSFFTGRAITRNLNHLVKAAERYSRGDLSRKIYAGTDDELKVLADAMNQMAFSLRDRLSEIQEEKSKVTAVLNHLTEGVMALDKDRSILAINPSAEDLLGVRAGQVTAQSLISTIQNESVDRMVERAIAEKNVIFQEIEFFHPVRKLLRISAVSITEENTKIAAILVLLDVTEMRRLERVRREFMANVSHELRTPLTSIKGFIETLLGGAMEDSVRSRQFLKIMEEDAGRLTRLTDDLLEISKIESHELPFHFEPVSLAGEIEKVIIQLKPLREAKKIKIENKIASQRLPDVKADRDKLGQVLMNLIENAVKFNRQEGWIRLEANLDTPEMIQVTISDSGIGIPESAIPRLFERFFRVDKARSRDLGGTGLGLAIVKHIVEAHGGKVSCRSQISEGSSFSFSLPIY